MPVAGVNGFVDRLIVLGRSLCARDVVEIDGVTYHVKEKIAEGGFSIIELVQQPRTKRYYALKRITCHSIEDQNVATKEIDYHKRLGGQESGVLGMEGSKVIGSADIVHGKTSDVLLLLPYYKNGTLQHLLEKRERCKDPLKESELLTMFLQICKGLESFHGAKPHPLAHRDLKPHNILLDEGLNPIIMDLGSVEKARLSINTHSQAQHLQDLASERCSITYRAPELFQVSSRCDIDERTDIWSLGCLLYALCYFKSPYDIIWEKGDSVALAVQSGGSQLYFPPIGDFSKELKDLIVTMLEPELHKRPFLTEVMTKSALLLEAAEDRV